MASACINNIGMSPEPFFSWDPEPDFEFRLQDPVTMLPADQLFSDGKLVPLHFKTTTSISATTSPIKATTASITTSDPILFSPKAPRCSSRWKDLLGLKKLYNNSTNTTTSSTTKTTSFSPSSKSFKHLPQPSPFPNQNNNNPFHRQHHIPSSTNRPLSSPPCYHATSSYPPTVTITFIFDPNYPVPLAIRHRQNTDSASDSRQTAPTTPMTNLLAASLSLAVNV